VGVVCITGATAGIGAATAKIFAARGDRIVIGARRSERLHELSRELTRIGAAAVLAPPLDVADEKSVKAFCNEALAFADQKIDVLVNNAGLAIGTDHVSKGNVEDWQTVIDTNVMGVLRVTRGILPAMLAANHGHIVMMGSIAGHHVYEGGAVYAATKHAVRAITQTLRIETNGSRVRFSSIDPGMVETEFSVVRFGDAEKAKNVYRGMTPLTADDIAECIEFVVSRPAHVNIDQITIMPTDQASVNKVHRS